MDNGYKRIKPVIDSEIFDLVELDLRKTARGGAKEYNGDILACAYDDACHLAVFLRNAGEAGFIDCDAVSTRLRQEAYIQTKNACTLLRSLLYKRDGV